MILVDVIVMLSIVVGCLAYLFATSEREAWPMRRKPLPSYRTNANRALYRIIDEGMQRGAKRLTDDQEAEEILDRVAIVTREDDPTAARVRGKMDRAAYMPMLPPVEYTALEKACYKTGWLREDMDRYGSNRAQSIRGYRRPG